MFAYQARVSLFLAHALWAEVFSLTQAVPIAWFRGGRLWSELCSTLQATDSEADRYPESQAENA